MKSYSGKILALVMAFGLLSSIAAIAQTPTPAAPRPVKFMVSLPTLTTAGLFTMLALKLDKAHGIDVEMQMAGGSSSIQIDAVLSGGAEFASPGALTALQAIREGANLRIIAPIANNQLATVISNDAMKKLGMSPTAPIGDRIRALKGFTIGTNPVGSTYHDILRSYLKQFGVDPDKDVKLVGIADSSSLISGLQYGRYDAITSASGVVEQAITLNAGKMWFSASRGDLPGGESVAVIVARADTLEKHRDDIDALRAAFGEALTAIRDNHAQTGRILQAAYFPKLDPAVWDLAWGGATAAYPANLTFTKAAFDYWIASDAKGAGSFKNVDYTKVVYGPAQAP